MFGENILQAGSSTCEKLSVHRKPYPADFQLATEAFPWDLQISQIPDIGIFSMVFVC